jgi:hypothetical protein
MKNLAILALAIGLTACGTLQRKQATFSAFEATDLQNAKTIFDAHYAVTGNPYDKAGSQCVATIIAHLPELNALSGLPATPLAAPITGLFSSIAGAQVSAEGAQAVLAGKLTLLRNGVPPDVHIACSYILVSPAALLQGLTALGPQAPPPLRH